MVAWYADGGVSGFWPNTASPAPEAYRLSSSGTVDTQAVSRLQYSLGSLNDRITAVARIRVTSTDLANNGIGQNYRRLGVTMFVAPATAFAQGKIPTPRDILGLGDALMAFRSTEFRYNNTPGDFEFNVLGPRASQLQANTKYWVLVIPTTWRNGTVPSVRNDWLVEAGTENIMGRAISVWTNRTPEAPVITSPASGSVVPAGTEIDFKFTASDPDAIFGGTSYPYTDVSGVQVQYAPRATVKDPNPVWRDLPFASLYGPLVAGPGWYIDAANAVSGTNFDRASGIRDLWVNLGGKIRCGSNILKAGMGILPSGHWQIRVRVFDYGHPYPGSGIKPFNRADGNYNPDNAPASNTSPWSAPVNISISAQVPPPLLVSPIRGNAVSAGRTVTLIWQYRNTHNPPLPQKTRIVDIRKVGDANWTLLVSQTSAATSVDIPPGLPGFQFEAGYEYEWRVQVTDTQNVASDYSETGRFWVVPAPASGTTRPLPTETVEGATLGCGTHRVFVYKRGGKVRVGEITELTHVDWSRVRDDISTARVDVANWSVDCGNLLSILRTWAYELVIFRDNGYSVDRVWEGPITLLRYERDKVTIQARDVMAWPYRRIVKQELNDRGTTVVDRAARVIQNVMAPDDPNVLAYLTVLLREDDAKQYRSLPPYSRTAFEEVDDMAANHGLDYTVAGRSIIVWGTKHRIGTLPEFRDEDLGTPPIVTEYGMSLANVYAVSDGAGLYGEANRLDENGEDPIYGLVEMLSSTWASDTEVEGPMTQERMDSIRASFEEYAERSIADRHPAPVLVRLPDNTTLNPSAVISIQQLVPGVAIPLRSTGTLRHVVTTQKLDSVKVVEEAGSETITITMSAFTRDDANMGEGAEE